MAKLIKTVQDRINFAIKKGLSGPVSPERMTEEVYAEILNIWRKYIKEYEKTREIGLYLSAFEKTEAITVDGGTASEGSKAVTECHLYPLSAVLTSGTYAGRNVDILTIGEYSHRFSHPNKGPEAEFPIVKFVNNTIYVAPRADVTVTHLAKPTRPIYAYTISGDEYIYNDAGSTDIDMSEIIIDDVVNRVLANLGIVFRDGDLINYSDRNKVTEGK